MQPRKERVRGAAPRFFFDVFRNLNILGQIPGDFEDGIWKNTEFSIKTERKKERVRVRTLSQ